MGRKITSKIEIEDGGQPLLDDSQTAEAFSCFFNDKVSKLANSSRYTPPQYEIPESNEFIAYSEIDVLNAINRLKRSKAQGFDEIPGLVIKDIGKLLLKPLCWLFNSISEHCQIPKAWKTSRVLPVFKKGDSKLVSNYRPISNISSVCKVFERCILNKLLEVGPSELFGPHQHGFFPNRSTITACLTVQDYVSQGLDNNRSVLMYSADLSAAFDMLRPETLTQTLVNININPNLTLLIRNYLSDRYSSVQINDSFSSMRSVPLGCVQGSVLGPSLFNIYTRGLGHDFPEHFFKISYADDSYVAVTCDDSDVDQKLEELSNVATKHFEWLEDIGMSCNRSKTEFIIFDRLGRHRDKTLKIGTDIITPTNSMRILGTIFQDNLKWAKHINKSIASANSMIPSLKYVSRFLTRPQYRMAINAHFVSKIMFASTVWHTSISAKERKKLNINLNRMARALCWKEIQEMKKTNKKPSNKFVYETSGLRSLTSLCTIADCTMLYKLCTGLSIDPLCERLMSQCHSNDRSSNRLYFFDYSHRKVGKNSFVHRAKATAEFLTFDWAHLTLPNFKSKLRDITPIFMK